MDFDLPSTYLNEDAHLLDGEARRVVFDLLGELGMVADVKQWFLSTQPQPVVFVGADADALTWRVRYGLVQNVCVVFLSSAALGHPPDQAIAIVAHEVGHAWLMAHGQPAGEVEADEMARQWGFGAKLADALEADTLRFRSEAERANEGRADKLRKRADEIADRAKRLRSAALSP